jgi:RNA polymerase sigma factor (sigma-70 family)
VSELFDEADKVYRAFLASGNASDRLAKTEELFRLCEHIAFPILHAFNAPYISRRVEGDDLKECVLISFQKVLVEKQIPEGHFAARFVTALRHDLIDVKRVLHSQKHDIARNRHLSDLLSNVSGHADKADFLSVHLPPERAVDDADELQSIRNRLLPRATDALTGATESQLVTFKCHLEGMKDAQIADKLHINKNSVRVRLSRARQQLRERVPGMLDSNGNEERAHFLIRILKEAVDENLARISRSRASASPFPY